MAEAHNIVWPESTALVTVQTPNGRMIKCKIASAEKLMFWAEDTQTHRQFEAVWNTDACKGFCEGLFLSPSELAKLLVGALRSDSDKQAEVSATVEITNSELVVNISWEPSQFLERRQLTFHVSEKSTSPTDRLEARMDEAETRLTHLEKPDQLLSTWKLDVCNPYVRPEKDGASGSIALMGNRFLIQDTDFNEKKTGVATKHGENGSIQATFEKPVYVKSIKIAPFPKRGWGQGISCNGAVSVQQFSLEDAEWKQICSLPQDTQEKEIPVNAEGFAWRLTGNSMTISKLIFK